MIDFDEFRIMTDGFIKKLDTSIGYVIKEKEETKLDYDLIEKLTGLVVKSSHYIGNQRFYLTPQFTQEQLIRYALRFYKSFGGKIYERALKTLLQIYPNIKLNVYDKELSKNSKRKNEFGHLEFTPFGRCASSYGNVTITVPLITDYNHKGNKKYSIASLYTLVHEIAHSLDIDYEGERDEILGKKIKNTRTVFSECTSIAFEYLLSQYLLSHTDINRNTIRESSIVINNSTRKDAVIVFSELLLAKEKEISGEINLNLIKKAMQEHHLTIQDVRSIAYNITQSPFPAFYQARYAIGRLVAPSIIKAYNNKGVQALEQYLNEITKGNLNAAASALNIDIRTDGMAKLVENMVEFESSIKENENSTER